MRRTGLIKKVKENEQKKLHFKASEDWFKTSRRDCSCVAPLLCANTHSNACCALPKFQTVFWILLCPFSLNRADVILLLDNGDLVYEERSWPPQVTELGRKWVETLPHFASKPQLLSSVPQARVLLCNPDVSWVTEEAESAVRPTRKCAAGGESGLFWKQAPSSSSYIWL